MTVTDASALRKKLEGAKLGKAPLVDPGGVAEHFLRRLAAEMEERFGTRPSLALTAASVRKMGDVIGEAPEPSLYGMVERVKGGQAGLMLMDAPFSYRMIEAMIGAADGFDAEMQEREFTAFDAAMADGFATLAVSAFDAAVREERGHPGRPRIRHGRTRRDPDCLTELDAETEVWALTLSLRFREDETPLTLHLAVALSALDDYRPAPPTQILPPEPPSVDVESAWAAAMATAAMKAEVRMVCVLHQRLLNLEELDDLQPGAIIPLPRDEGLTVELRLDAPGGVTEESAVAQGRLGAAEGWRAIKMDGPAEDGVLAQLKALVAAPEEGEFREL